MNKKLRAAHATTFRKIKETFKGGEENNIYHTISSAVKKKMRNRTRMI